MAKFFDVGLAVACAAISAGNAQEHRPILAACFAVVALINLIDYAKRPLG
jgi:hypothetical protein